MLSIALSIANITYALPSTTSNIALIEQNTLLNNEIPKNYATSTVEAILRYNAELDVLEDIDISDNIYCSCVKTARSEGLKLPPGDADNLKPNSMPVEGGGILLKYGNVYHVAKILNFTPSGFFIVEGNKVKCKKTYRVVLYNDKAIRGFWSAPSS